MKRALAEYAVDESAVGVPTEPQASTTALGLVAEKSVPTGAAEPLGAGQVARRGVLVKAPSTNSATVYLGGSGVTMANGYPLDPGEAVALEVADVAAVYCVAASAGQKLRALAL